MLVAQRAGGESAAHDYQLRLVQTMAYLLQLGQPGRHLAVGIIVILGRPHGCGLATGIALGRGRGDATRTGQANAVGAAGGRGHGRYDCHTGECAGGLSDQHSEKLPLRRIGPAQNIGIAGQGGQAQPGCCPLLGRLQLRLTIDFAGQDSLYYASQLNFQDRLVREGRGNGIVADHSVSVFSSAWACINCC